MKRTCVFLSVLLLMSAAAAAAGGPVEGKKFEFSTAISFDSIHYNYGTSYSETDTYFNIPFRLGYFIWKGLEFEPELLLMTYHEKWTTGSYNETSWLLSGNLVYNFKLKSPRWIPFILGGFGFGNGVPYSGTIERWSSQAKVTTPNLGVGVKYLFGNIAALRLEYRFRSLRFKYSGVEMDAGPVQKISHNSVFLGLCLYF